MYVPEITEVKERLDELKRAGVVAAWELPYENILTRRSAAVFFVAPAEGAPAGALADGLSAFEDFSCRSNTEKKLSDLPYRVTFSSQEKQTNPEPAEQP